MFGGRWASADSCVAAADSVRAMQAVKQSSDFRNMAEECIQIGGGASPVETCSADDDVAFDCDHVGVAEGIGADGARVETTPAIRRGNELEFGVPGLAEESH